MKKSHYIQIVSALLASGHFTRPAAGPNDDPQILRFDRGEDWKTEGYNSRFSSDVLDEADRLAAEIDQREQQQDG